nr:uncharacterized protein LOC122271940 [Parasteatoda tepidariorum]
MRIIYKILIFTLIATNCYSAQQNGQREKLTGLQVYISPRSAKDRSQRGSEAENNVADIKAKSIQLEISSGDKIENKVDLLIAATKEVQTTPEADRYSPTYNAAMGTKNDHQLDKLKDDTSSNYFGPTQRNSESLFSPEEYTGMFPFPAMRSLLPPSLFPMGSHFPAMRHFEDSYEPHSLSNNMRNLHGDPQLDLALLQPVYPHSSQQNMAGSPQLHSNPYSVGGMAHGFNEQQHPNSAAVRTHQNIPIIQTIPSHMYPHHTPLMAPVGDLQQAHYRKVNQEPNSALPDSYMRNDPRQERLLRQPYQHAPQGAHEHIPRNQLHPGIQHLSQNVQGHSIPQPGSYIQAHPSAGSRLPQNLSHLDLLRELQKTLHPSTGQNVQQRDQVRHIPPLTEHQERNRLYAPVQQNSALTKAERDSKKENDHYMRQVMPVHQNYRTINMLQDKPIMPNHAKPLTNRPTYHRQLPQYTLISHESLPKYLKEQQPTSNQHQDSSENLRSHHNNLNSNEHQPQLRSPHYHNRLPADLIARDHPRTTGRYHAPQRLPTSTNYEGNIRSPNPSSDLRSNVHEIQQHFHHRNIYTEPPYERPSNIDSNESTGINSELASNHAVPSSGRPTYDLSEVDLNNLPSKKFMKKSRKRMRSKKDDLEGHASHQYIIKIR